MDYIIRNGLVVNEGRAERRDVSISGGRFVAAVDAAQAEVVDATGCLVMPGVIDTHVHFREPGLTEKADMASESRAAVAGGVTSVVDMPNTLPQTTTLADLEEKERIAADKCVVNYGFMLGATNDNIDELLSISPERYAAIKLFLGSSTGNMLVVGEERLNRLFRDARKLIVAHCEEETIVQRNLSEYKSKYEGTAEETAALHPLIRSAEACYESTRKALERARRFGTRFHVAHLTTAAELALLDCGPLAEKHITAEVSPNHLWFTDADYPRLGNLIKCNPAIKSAADRDALLQALKDGVIDTVATDHAPHTLASKQKNYFVAPGGIPSIQHSLPMMLELLSENGSLTDDRFALLVERMCHNPARIFGLRDRGFIREGYWADLAIVRLGVGETVSRDNLKYKCGWSPLEGHAFSNSVVATFVNGVPYREGVNSAMPLEFDK